MKIENYSEALLALNKKFPAWEAVEFYLKNSQARVELLNLVDRYTHLEHSNNKMEKAAGNAVKILCYAKSTEILPLICEILARPELFTCSYPEGQFCGLVEREVALNQHLPQACLMGLPYLAKLPLGQMFLHLSLATSWETIKEHYFQAALLCYRYNNSSLSIEMKNELVRRLNADPKNTANLVLRAKIFEFIPFVENYLEQHAREFVLCSAFFENSNPARPEDVFASEEEMNDLHMNWMIVATAWHILKGLQRGDSGSMNFLYDKHLVPEYNETTFKELFKLPRNGIVNSFSSTTSGMEFDFLLDSDFHEVHDSICKRFLAGHVSQMQSMSEPSEVLSNALRSEINSPQITILNFPNRYHKRNEDQLYDS